jgi:hypothetical protein
MYRLSRDLSETRLAARGQFRPFEGCIPRSFERPLRFGETDRQAKGVEGRPPAFTVAPEQADSKGRLGRETDRERVEQMSMRSGPCRRGVDPTSIVSMMKVARSTVPSRLPMFTSRRVGSRLASELRVGAYGLGRLRFGCFLFDCKVGLNVRGTTTSIRSGNYVQIYTDQARQKPRRR